MFFFITVYELRFNIGITSDVLLLSSEIVRSDDVYKGPNQFKIIDC